ncbi:MAG: GNAT family N-acetyltransferase [Spirochaetes bacterium]|jgi:GNAT superfamily N-acetyltransferase|nr:GNAT family N-acetyltransferase [Spirochaetota bacterium]
MTDKKTGEFEFRLAGIRDVDVLTSLRVELLREMGNIKTAEGVPELENGIRAYFRSHIIKGDFICWVAVSGGGIVATSGLVVIERPPIMGNQKGLEGYIMNIYTRPASRKMGAAAGLMKMIKEHAESAGINMLWLHATPGGRRLYEGQGFTARAEMEKSDPEMNVEMVLYFGGAY